MKTFRKRFKYHIGLGFAGLMVFSSLFSFFNPSPQVSAQTPTSATWIDHSTIRYDGHEFTGPLATKDGSNDVFRYTSKDKNDCGTKDFIDFDDDPTKAGTSVSPGFIDRQFFNATEAGSSCDWSRNKRITMTNVSVAKMTKAQVACMNKPDAEQQQCVQNEALRLCGATNGTVTPAVQACINAQTQGTPGGVAYDPLPEDDPVVEEDPELDCKADWSPLTWVLCPFAKLVNSTLNGLDNAITGLLTIEADKIFDTSQNPGKGYYESWKVFRSLALGLLVVGALIMIISQALGFDFLDAYTIKKVVPRLLVAIIGIALSWEIMSWFVILTNNLGLGVRSLIYYPFVQGGMGDLGDTAIAGNYIVALLAVGGFFGLGLLGLLSFGATALLALLVAFLVLILRQLVIVVLVLFAPLAIAAYILPNTQSIWKLWYESFTKALMMFPIIMAFLAVGRVFAMTSGGEGATVVGQIIAFIAYILPYFLIPLTFRFAGGALRTLGGFVNDRGRGGFDRLKKYRQGQWQSHGGVRVQRASDRALQARYSAYNRMKNAKGPVSKRLARVGMGAVGGFNMEEKISAANEREQKRMGSQTASGPDALPRAYTVNKKHADDLRKDAQTLRARATSTGAAADIEAADKAEAMAAEYIRTGKNGGTEYRTLGGSWAKEADVVRSQAAFGKNNHAAFQSALTYEMGKALTQEEQDHLKSAYGSATKRFGMDEQQANEVWIGSAYAKQNEHRQWKHTKWEMGEDGHIVSRVNGVGLMREVDEKQTPGAMMQQGADNWTTMSEQVIEARKVMDRSKLAPEHKEYVAPSSTAYKEARETLDRATRIAFATRSASYAPTGTGEGGGDGTPAPQALPPELVINQTAQTTVVTPGAVAAPASGADAAAALQRAQAAAAAGGRPAGAGAAGRVQEEINKFLATVDREAGLYQAPDSAPKPGTPVRTPDPARPEGLDGRRR